MGDERAETYLRLLAEAETRRPGRGPGPDIARSVEQVRWAGDILVAAGLLEEVDVRRTAAELEAALLARSDPARPDRDRSRLARRVDWVLSELDELTELTGTGPAERAAPPGLGPEQPMWVTLVGRRIGVTRDRAPSDLHLLTLVGSPAGVTITAAMRMRWPPDGSSADLEITGAGPQHLPYDQLWAADDRGTRYRVGMGGEGGTLTWQGTLGLVGELPPDARWLDLIADGTHRLARIDLSRREEVRPAAAEQAPAVLPGERILAAAAEHILASAWDSSGPRAPARLGETITVLSEAGALAPDSPAPGHLAAACQHLGVRGHEITAPPAAQIPARWAEVLPPPGPADPADPADSVGPGSSGGPPGPEWFAPAGPAAADADGTRFAFAGLTWAAGKSILHVVAAGPPPRPTPHWYAGWSWWVRDGAGGWHLAAETDPDPHTGGLASGSGTVAFRLRLTPPLPARPDAIEVEVTGRRDRARTVVPVGPDMPDT